MIEDVVYLKAMVNTYYAFLGQPVNLFKSQLMTSPNVLIGTKNQIRALTQMHPITRMWRNLDVLIFGKVLTKRAFSFIEEKIIARIQSWKWKSPIHGWLKHSFKICACFNSYLLPLLHSCASLCNKYIKKRIPSFLVGHTSNKLGLHLIAWKNVCRQHNEGELGIIPLDVIKKVS